MSIEQHNISHKLIAIQQRIDQAVKQSDANSQPVKLLAVSKTKSSQMIRTLAEAGQQCFGENYCQEAIQKQQQLNDLPLEWHFIGSIQSNKTQDIAHHFDWVHTIDRYKIAQRLSAQRPTSLPALNILIQVNIDNEASKSGISSHEVLELADKIQSLPNLALRGIMCIPAPKNEPQKQLASFLQVSLLFETMKNNYPLANIDTLSMGMSNDLEPAIMAGSTLVRVGSALFGQRVI